MKGDTVVEISGTCDPRFRRVQEAFEKNFQTLGEKGAAVSLYAGNQCLVDLWGGVRDASSNTPWTADTLVNVWSTTKGVVAACMVMAVERGVFDYDDKVADYWPEFGAAGKQDVTIAMLLSHQAGLCGFRDAARVEDFYDVEAAAARLAAAEPFWIPGTQSGYHAITYGVLASALLRRAEGRTLREFVRTELHAQCGLDIHIGLPPGSSAQRATLSAPENLESAGIMTDLSEAQVAALANPPLDPLQPNTPGWQAAEIPAANGHATARSLAALYGGLATTGEVNGVKLASPSTISRASRIQSDRVDAVLSTRARWACGFLGNTDGLYGATPSSFGHSGWGGSFAFTDPELGLGFAYTMNQMGTDLIGDPRNMALIQALYESVD